MRAGEGQELDRVAPLVGLHVRFGAVGRGDNGGVIGSAILRRRCGLVRESKRYPKLLHQFQ
jgi:hypothetical protein